MNLQAARRYEDVLSAADHALPYEFPVLFKADGWSARRRARSRFKLLKAIDPKLRRILRTGERVYFVTPGTTATWGEQFFMGWAAQLLNMRALIFTTERILLLQIDRRGRPRQLVSQIAYTAIAEVKSTWTGMCRIKLTNGTTFNFQRVPRADRAFLVEILADLTQGAASAPAGSPGIENLCPHCFDAVPGHPDACPSCAGGFKSVRKAALLSLLFPGLGDWYLGHRGFACLEMLGAAFFWFAWVVAPLIEPPNSEYGPPDAVTWIVAAFLLGLMHTIDAVMTRHFARKGHHPDVSTVPVASPGGTASAFHAS